MLLYMFLIQQTRVMIIWPFALAVSAARDHQSRWGSNTGPRDPNSKNYYGKFVGEFNTYAHKVTGLVYAVDDDTLFIKNFTYDGNGPGESKAAISNQRIRVLVKDFQLNVCYLQTLSSGWASRVNLPPPAQSSLIQLNTLGKRKYRVDIRFHFNKRHDCVCSSLLVQGAPCIQLSLGSRWWQSFQQCKNRCT